MHLESSGRDFFLKATDAKGRVTIRMHRVWNVDLFLDAQIKANEKAKADEKMKLEASTREEYLAQQRAAK